jgi:hypothetical protein
MTMTLLALTDDYMDVVLEPDESTAQGLRQKS